MEIPISGSTSSCLRYGKIMDVVHSEITVDAHVLSKYYYIFFKASFRINVYVACNCMHAAMISVRPSQNQEQFIFIFPFCPFHLLSRSNAHK